MVHSSIPAASRKRKSTSVLTLRKDGRYCKKVRGKIYYFPGPEVAALEEWRRVQVELLKGEPRPLKVDGLTVAELCDKFLQSKDRQQDLGKITARHRANCGSVTDTLVASWKHRAVSSLTAEDFEKLLATYAKGRGVVSVGNFVQHVRMVFKFGVDNGHLSQPVCFGQLFKRPSKKELRKAKREKGSKLFEAADIVRLLAAADVHLRAMIYLGINCGFGNADCGTVPLEALNLKTGWVTYHRPKTEISRRCKLWPETIEALTASIAARPEPKDEADKGLTFITKYGRSWHKDTTDNPVTKEFRKLLGELDLHRPGLGFYTLRHVFRTEAGAAKDVEAIRHVMGHVNEHVEEGYIEYVPDARLEAVASVVHGWLFSAK